MINRRMLALGKEPSAIRQLFAYGVQRKAEIGEENVFDLSIGNPSIPAPIAIKNSIQKQLQLPAEVLHGYSVAAGLYETRTAIARNLEKRFGVPATPENVYVTVGAMAALDCVLAAVTQPGEEVIVNAPYFPEYKVLIETAGATCVEVRARESDFQLDIAALDNAIVPQTAAVIINSPNNPVGCIYTEDTIKDLAALLQRKSQEFGHAIYLISDEPYREIVYEAKVPFTASYYNETIVCYSWAKSFSLPGERIGYAYVSDYMEQAADVFAAIAGAGRALGYVCAPVLFQRVIAECIDEPTNVDAYAHNRKLLTQGLDRLEYRYIQPDGAFYLWIKALEGDAQAFSNKAKAHDLLVVPSDSFGVPGWVRASYCVSAACIENSLVAWEALSKEYR